MQKKIKNKEKSFIKVKRLLQKYTTTLNMSNTARIHKAKQINKKTKKKDNSTIKSWSEVGC